MLCECLSDWHHSGAGKPHCQCPDDTGVIGMKRILFLLVYACGWFVAVVLSAVILSTSAGSLELLLLGLFWLAVAVLVWRSQSKRRNGLRDDR